MSPTRQDQRSSHRLPSEELVTRAVQEAEGLDRLFEDSLPAFGGAYLRRMWQLLDDAIGKALPMTLAIAGPVTVSGQHYTWLNPLLETGWFVLLSTTDAVCYHDGHRAPRRTREKRPFFHVSRLRRRRRAARRAHHPRHRRRLPRGDAARPGPLPPRAPARARVPAQDDRHRVPLPARRRYAAQEQARTASPRACSPSARARPSRSSSARRATARCS